MKIGGLQKFSLLDYPDKLCAIVFTAGCNFRCPFCHNPLLVNKLNPSTFIDQEEVLSFLASRTGKLDGVCVTGGEPLLQKDLPDFLRKIHDLGFLIKLDTNGSFPDRLSAMIDEQLIDYIAMDIKNSLEKYPQTIDNYETEIINIQRSAELLLKSSIQYEFRTTIVREFHTCDDIRSIGEWLTGGARYFLQNFRDSGDLIGFCTFHSFTLKEMEKMKQIAQQFFQFTEVRT